MITATIKINTKSGIKSITKEFNYYHDAHVWITKFNSEHYFGYTNDGTFALVWDFDFSQLDTPENA